MEPIKSNTSTTGKCLNPVLSKCVVWDGPDITCIDGTKLCKGQNIEATLYTVATRLCEVYAALNLEDINTCINDITSGTAVTVSSDSTIKEVFSAIINKICALDARVTTLEQTETTILTAVVPECLRVAAASYSSWDATFYTLNLVQYANLVATEICNMLYSITVLQGNVITINKNIADLWYTLNSCSNATTNLVQPTCTNNFQLNPTNSPQSIQIAYAWLESDFCNLQTAVGTPDSITTNIAKQCPALGDADRLSSGGIMSSLSGWVDTPTTLADSLGNLWLTVCDMRTAVSQILDTCCFSPCSYLEFSYDLIFDPNGTYVNIVFNDTGSFPIIYNSSAATPPATSPYIAHSGDSFVGPLAWIETQFPLAGQSNVVITLDDGNGNTITVATGSPITTLALLSNAYDNGVHVVYASANPSYDVQSTNQTINFSFDYEVFDPVTSTTTTCTINQTDGFVFECDNPPIYPYNVEITSVQGTDLTIVGHGLYTETLSIESGPVLSSGSNTLTVTGTPWTVNQFTHAGSVSDATANIVYITSGPAAGQTRIIVSNTTDTLTVDSDWTIAPSALDTFEIKNKYYQYPFASTSYFPTYIQNILSFDIQIVTTVNPTGTPAYDPLDPSTWNVVAQTIGLSPDTLCTTGWTYPPNQALNGNSTYAVTLRSNYACNSSDWSVIDNLMEIPVSVTVVSTSTSILSNASVSISDRLSNDVAPNYLTPNPKTATISSSVQWPAALPVLPNLTQFSVSPQIATWGTQGSSPQYCLCGMPIDPDGTTGGTLNRDLILGSYRGYDVSLNKFTPPNTYVPIVDSLYAAYITNSIDDPTLSFSNNTPGAPILLDIPSTYATTSYPLVITYDPSSYPVEISTDYHTMTSTGFTYSYSNNSCFTFVFDITVTMKSYYWDSSTNTYVAYSAAGHSDSFTYSTSVAPAGSGSVSVPGLTVSATYGDKIFFLIDITKHNGTCGLSPIVNTITGGYVTTTPLPGSSSWPTGPFSCAGTSVQTNGVSGTTHYTVGYKGLVTEDYIITTNNITHNVI